MFKWTGRLLDRERPFGPLYSPRWFAGLTIVSRICRRESADGNLPTGICRRESADGNLPTGIGRRESADGNRPTGIGRRESADGNRPTGIGRRESANSCLATVDLSSRYRP